MLVDILSAGNLVSYNTRIAALVGLHPAIYISELLTINDKAIKKGKTKENYFELDREYIRSRTTFSIDEQLEIEKKLLDIGILNRLESDPNLMYLDVERLTSLFMTDDEKLIHKIKVVTEKKTKVTKEEKIFVNLQQYVDCPNDELRQAYYDWIEAALQKNGWLSKVSVQEAQQQVDAFSDRILDVALAVVKIAAINGYRDMQWAIEKYRQTPMIKGVVHANNEEDRSKLGDIVF